MSARREDVVVPAQRRSDEDRERRQGVVLHGLVVLLVVLLGAPQVWQRVAVYGGFGPELLFFPLLAVAFTVLAVERARR